MTGRKRGQAGETIVESLVSMLIISLVFVFLVNAIVASARVNAAVSAEDSSFDLSAAQADGTVRVSVAGNTVTRLLYVTTSEQGEGAEAGEEGGVTYYYYQ